MTCRLLVAAVAVLGAVMLPSTAAGQNRDCSDFSSQREAQPGAVAWHQVNTRDPDKAREFYEAVFGWNWQFALSRAK